MMQVNQQARRLTWSSNRKLAQAAMEALETRALLSTITNWSPSALAISQGAEEQNYPNINGQGQTIAVIDHGIDATNPNLDPSKILYSYNFATNSTTVVPGDGHATGVAGILTENVISYGGYQTQGVAQGANLINLQTGDGGDPSAEQHIKAALDWVLANRVQYNITCVNLTDFVGSGPNLPVYESELQQLYNLNVWVISPVGNGGPGVPIDHPAADAYDFGAGAVNNDLSLWSGTQTGPGLDILAPGNGVLQIYEDLTQPPGQQYIVTPYGQGTSWANAFSTGAAVLLKQINPGFTPLQIMTILQKTGSPVYDASTGNTYSCINLNAAVKEALVEAAALGVSIPTAAPLSPVSLTASATSSSQINLTWTANATSPLISNYIVQQNIGGTWKTIATVPGTATSYVVTGLTPFTQYSFQVIAYNLLGNSAPTGPTTATTQQVGTLPTGWSNQDVGAPTIAGSSTYKNGVFTVTGSGNDIWNPSDQFQFASSAISGDTTIIARVTSQTNTSSWAKAGVMIRASSAANSAFVMLVQTPGNGVALQWRDSSGNVNWTAGPKVTGPVWLKLVRVGTTFTGYVSTDGTTYTNVGSTGVAMPTAALAGLAVTSHYAAVSSTATFDNVAISAATTALPTGWSSADIGSPALAGSTAYSNGVFTISGSGNDIWNPSDQFQYASTTSVGDETLTARVLSQTNTASWAKAGVMFRSSTTPIAQFVDVVQTPGNGVALQWRDANGQVNWIQGPKISGAAWVRLARVGNTFTGYASSDGITWTTIGSVTITMPTAIMAGLAVTSHNSTLISTATIDSVTLA